MPAIPAESSPPVSFVRALVQLPCDVAGEWRFASALLNRMTARGHMFPPIRVEFEREGAAWVYRLVPEGLEGTARLQGPLRSAALGLIYRPMWVVRVTFGPDGRAWSAEAECLLWPLGR